MIFSRGRGRHTRPRSRDDAVDVEADDAVDRPEFGPYDATQAPDDGLSRLDLGSLRIPAVPGVEVRLDAGTDGQIRQVQLAHGASRLQLGVFAAPRTEGIWEDVRAQLRGQLHGGGGRPQETEGEYGPELRGRVKEGSSQTDVRHVGIDGPRWFVHAIYVGAAASDPERAGPLRDVLRGLVVDRGVEARPVSEPLPLRLPPEAVAQMADQPGQADQPGEDSS